MSTLARGLSPVRERLDNGTVVLAQENSTAPAVTISASVLAGSLYEPEDLPGLASLTAKLLDRGTEHRSADRIVEELDDRGVALKVSASRHDLTITTTCLAEDYPDVLRIVADVVRRPVFPEGQLQRRRAEVITGLRQDEDNPFLRAIDALVMLLYGPTHPYGRPFKGSIATIAGLDRGAVAAFHARCFQPAALSLAIVGDIAPAAAVRHAAVEFGDWCGEPPDLTVVPPPPPAGGRRRQHVEMPGKPQADIAYGFTTISRLDPRYYAYWLMNNILGEFGLGGRLAANIRERQGMAYYAFSSFDAALGEAPLVVRAGVDPRNVERAIEAIDTEVRQLGMEGPSCAEVDAARRFLIGSIPRMFETNQSIAAFLQSAEHLGLGLDYDQRLPALLEAVTIEEVAAAAAEVLRPEGATIAVAGPVEAVA
ncbi:pitrilysin family protein [soil metagenome]